MRDATPEPPAPTPSATTAPTPRAGCASCGEPLTQSRYVKADWYCTNRACSYFLSPQPIVPPASAPAATPEPERLLEKLTAWQAFPYVHPLTCGNDSQHENLVPTMVDGRVLLVCPDCDYRQEGSSVAWIAAPEPEGVLLTVACDACNGTGNVGPGQPCQWCSAKATDSQPARPTGGEAETLERIRVWRARLDTVDDGEATEIGNEMLDALTAQATALAALRALVPLAQDLIDSGYQGGHYLGVDSWKFCALRDALAALAPRQPEERQPDTTGGEP